MPMGLHTKDTPGNGRVLVVDDEENVRSVIRMILTKAGYDVVEAWDGANAMEVIRADDNPLMVDVITCDIRMPKVNGLEAIEYFREQFPSTPVVVLTGYPDTLLAVSLIQKGVVDYVTKPIESAKLVAVVEQAMKHRTALKD
jgi:two-component system chemotaxis response regulator CheY